MRCSYVTVPIVIMLVQIAGEHKVMTAETAADCQQVLRHLGEIHPSLPLWRQQRPALHLHSAHPSFNTADPSAHGSLVLRSVLLLLSLQNRNLTVLCLLVFVQLTLGFWASLLLVLCECGVPGYIPL